MVQLPKQFTKNYVKELLKRYARREIEIHYILEVLGIRRSRFFLLLKHYKECPHEFLILYKRGTKTRTIPQAVEDNILRELPIERT